VGGRGFWFGKCTEIRRIPSLTATSRDAVCDVAEIIFVAIRRH